MDEFVVQSVAFAYSSEEDRILLRCDVKDRTYDLWMTQLLVKKLSDTIIHWVERLKLETTIVQTKKVHEQVRGAVKSTPSYHHKTDALDKSVTSSVANRPSSKSAIEHNTSAKPLQSIWLCSNANVVMSRERIQVALTSNKSIRKYLFIMSPFEAGGFLLALYKSLDKVYWRLKSPEWLGLESSLHNKLDSNFLH